MTSKSLNIFKTGFYVLRSQRRLIFVAALVFIFPLLFLYVTNSFIETAQSNVETAEKQRVAILHDSVAVLLSQYETNPDLLRQFLATQAEEATDITEIRLTKKTADGYLILESRDDDKEGSFEAVKDMYTTAHPDAGASLIFEFSSQSGRTWQAIRAFEINNSTYYVVSEHSFKTFDSVMQSRIQHSYLVLTAIFAFLIALAYWLGRQIDWHSKYDAAQVKLQERDMFTSMIAHEFRTPLTAIRGYTSFLEESPSLAPKEQAFLQNIKISTERLLALVNDFLEVARIQSGKMGIVSVETDIQPIIMSVVEALTPLAVEKKLIVSYKPLATPIIHKTDATRLYQVLQNLISNSLKYTKEGSIEISTELTPLSVAIIIKDTGMGISAEDQQKLFAPFSRVGGVEKSTITGTGLGMWITKQMVELMRGTLSIESMKGVGTRVIVALKR